MAMLHGAMLNLSDTVLEQICKCTRPLPPTCPPTACRHQAEVTRQPLLPGELIAVHMHQPPVSLCPLESPVLITTPAHTCTTSTALSPCSSVSAPVLATAHPLPNQHRPHMLTSERLTMPLPSSLCTRCTAGLRGEVSRWRVDRDEWLQSMRTMRQEVNDKLLQVRPQRGYPG